MRFLKEQKNRFFILAIWFYLTGVALLGVKFWLFNNVGWEGIVPIYVSSAMYFILGSFFLMGSWVIVEMFILFSKE